MFTLPQASPLSHSEKIRTALIASVAIFLTGWLARLTIDGGGLKTLLASMSALAYQRFLLTQPIALAPRPSGGGPAERLGLQADDLRAALADMHEFIDVGERELNEIYKLATAHAFHRHFGEPTTAAEVMTPNPLTVEFGTELEQAWALVQKHSIKVLPVIDRGRHVIGIVTQSDFFRHARAKEFNGLGGKLRELLKASPTVTSQNRKWQAKSWHLWHSPPGIPSLWPNSRGC